MVDAGVYLPRSSDERALLISEAKRGGFCAIVSAAGVLIYDKPETIRALKMLIDGAMAVNGDSVATVYTCTDPDGISCIAMYTNQPSALYAYGLTELDFLTNFADQCAETLQ